MKTWVVVAALPLTMCAPNTTQEPEFMVASAESTPVICTDGQMAEKVKSVMIEALDAALKNHIMHTFEIWMKDDRDQPARARVGVRNGIIAYIAATKGAMAWAPMECPG